MFEIIKEKVTLEQVMRDVANINLIEAGEWSEPEDKKCPFCSHNDCFKVNPDKTRFQCFSGCSEGDIFDFVAKAYSLESTLDAAKAIAKQYSIEVPSGYSVVREITRLAAEYFHNNLLQDTNEYAVLGGMTPLDYQRRVRGHSDETIARFQTGWADGGLIEYLRAIGFEDEVLKETGLVSKKDGDFLPARTFIYPHKVGGAIGHFTFKDPNKKLEWQVAKKFRHAQWAFYNQNSVKAAHTVIVVEGENDVQSTAAQATEGVAVIGCIGMISREQIEWLATNCKDKKVVCIFDPDDAGDKYWDKMQYLKGRVGSLGRISLPKSDDPEKKAQDIDDLLRGGASLSDILQLEDVASQVGEKPVVEMVSSSGEVAQIEVDAGPDSTGTILEHDGAYYKIRYKEGVPVKLKLTNFIIKLKNIYIQGDRREREVVFIREDRKQSRPVNVSSEVKVSLKSFKSLVANAVDASFYGREDDLALLWDHVYQGLSEKEVYLPSCVGHLREFKGWLFRDAYISDEGSLSPKGTDGVIWVGGSTSAGIKPVPLADADEGNSENIPTLTSDLDAESREQLEAEFVANLNKNLGDVGVTLTALAWMKSCAYSNKIYDWRRDFPFLFLWGRHGRGKTYVAKWLAGIYGTDECGYTTISGMRRSAGFFRKLAYYSSLPVVVDEVRADRDTVEMYGTFRSWYQRSGRTLGTKEEFGIREQKVLSTFMFVGQDQFTDSALRQRCVPIRIPIHNRELEHSFRWIESRRSDLSAIGLSWILESSTVNFQEIIDEIQELNQELRNEGCPQRTSLNWALIAAFGRPIARKHFPGFDFFKYVKEASSEDSAEQESEDVLAQFFQVVEGLQASDKLSGVHINADGNYIYIWITEVFRIVEKELVQGAREDFSKKALTELLKEEPWCISVGEKGAYIRATMGDGQQRRVMKFDRKTAPEYIKVLGDYNIIRS